MNTAEFVAYLESLGIKITVEGDRLRCNAPQGVLTPDLKNQLAQRKGELLEHLQPKKQSSLVPLLRVPREQDLPLSSGQQRLWLINQLDPQSPAYNTRRYLRLEGKLNLVALEQSIGEIVRRHEILRTNFVMMKGTPLQVIAPMQPVALPVVDLQQLPEVEKNREVEKIVDEEGEKIFSLDQGFLWRFKLLRLESESSLLLLNWHHIIFDGWSMRLFMEELTSGYREWVSHGTPTLLELPLQYGDYAHWQRQCLEKQVENPHLDYWKNKLAGIPPIIPLATDYARASVQEFRCQREIFYVAPHLHKQLRSLTQETGTTLFTGLLTVFGVLLSRYSNQSDIIIGSPVAGRNRQEIESLIGFFVNTLVLRLDIPGDLTFLELLLKVRQVALEAYQHQELPFEQLVNNLETERSLSYAPIAQVMFTFQPQVQEEWQLPDLKMTLEGTETIEGEFDLILSLRETKQGLRGVLQYNGKLFKAETINRMAGHFQTLLANMLANPQRAVSELSLLTEPEQQQLLVTWNDTKGEYPQDHCIHQLFEEQASKTPNALALVFEQQTLTYEALNNRANQLAHYLRSQGVTRETLVGISLDRSLETIIVLLAIFKAGGAYLPLDPHYPPERLSYMLSDAQPQMIITMEELASKLPSSEAQILCLDRSQAAIAHKSEANLHSGVKPHNLAYLIYTSGSTGKPKGVQLEHRGLCNLAIAQQKLFKTDLNSRILQFASLNFDASIWEIVMALGSGASLHLANSQQLLPGTDLFSFLEQQQITHVTLPPSVLKVMPKKDLPHLTTIIVAGEACSRELVEQWSDRRRFFNAYGPTESTVCATVALCEDVTEKPTIGRPIANMEMYLLDQYLQPVPMGVPGELHIGGVGLARGYLNRPQLTQEKFISNPFESGKLLYKTGDLGRYLPEGRIEFLGRIDNQVKIRGFRIELGEIEVALRSHPAIKDVVVVAKEDPVKNNYLVSYWVGKEGQQLSDNELLFFLQKTIPNYMIPSLFIKLETLPLTANGKVDRRALPEPDIVNTGVQTLVSPRTPSEVQLANIWKEVLNVAEVGIYANFFVIGGDSLLATQIVSRIAESFHLKLAFKTLFENPNIAGLAMKIDQLKQEQKASKSPVITPVSRIPRRINSSSLKKRNREQGRGS